MTDVEKTRVALRKAAAQWAAALNTPVVTPDDRASKALDDRLARAALRYAEAVAKAKAR